MKYLLRASALVLLVASAAAWADDKVAVPAPRGLLPVPVPPDNSLTPKKIELGRLLYFDKRLSHENEISCASCHDPKEGWAEHKPTSEGVHGQPGERNAPTIINSAYATSQFWDGRSPTLEEQAAGPIENPVEMGSSMKVAVEGLNAVPRYRELFREVFGTEVTRDGVIKAVASFERTIVSENSRYDKYMAGDKNALNEQERRGLALFTGRALCATCHTPPVFSNFTFINAGIGSADKEHADPGRMKVTGLESDKGAFKVPRLRDIVDTYPYFHNGSVPALRDAVNVMAAGGIENPDLSPIFALVKGARLAENDKVDLVAFLGTLSGDYPRIEPPVLP